jgi:hypothetical protein
MARPSKYSPEVRERFVRLVQEHTAERRNILTELKRKPSTSRHARPWRIGSSPY